MVSDTLTQADTEFQQGNFDVAATLYAEAVAGFDQQAGDSKALASLIQKLADSEYAQNKFSEARDGYSKLVALQEQEGFAAKDKVSAYLKLAKTADKCEAHEDAAQSFKSAYETLSSLSATHFLRKSVIDAYADYLRTRGDDAELLAKLEDELGIKRNEAEAKPAVEEVTPDSIPTPIATPKKSGGEEFFVLKSRLDKFKTRRVTEPEGEGEEKAPTVLEKKTEKTVEQEVAERKFLRKSDPKDKEARRSSQRSSLRSAMAKDNGQRAEGQTNEPDIPDATSTYERLAALQGSNATEFDASVPASEKELPAVLEFAPTDDAPERPREMDRSSLPEDLYPTAADSNLDAGIPQGKTEYYYQDRDLAKFVGRRPKRTLRDTGHTGDSQIAAPSLAVEAVSMPEATRSFLQQSEAVKKSIETQEVAPDVEQLRVDGRVETVVPASQKLISTLKLISPIIGLVLMLGAGAFLLKSLAPTKSTGALPSFVVNMVGRKFVTADGALSLTVDRSKVILNSGGVTRDAALKIWNGDWRDEIALLQGAYRNTRWLIVKPEGLKDPEGGTFYAMDAPERKTIFYCKEVAEAAQKYFMENRKFPSYGTDLGNLASYPNPYSGKASALLVSSTVDNKRVDMKPNAPLDVLLQNGEWFKGEVAGAPGDVHALSVSGQPTFSEAENTYTWTTQCFYIHAFDRNKKFIEGSGEHKVFLLVDKNGNSHTYNADTREIEKHYAGADVCLSQTEKPRSDGVLFKYLAILIGLIVAVGVATMSSRMGRFRR